MRTDAVGERCHAGCHGCGHGHCHGTTGGIGILPVSQTIAAQCVQVEAVKRFKAGFQTQIITLSPEQSIADVIAIMAETGYSTFPVTDTGVFHGKLLGVITDKDFDVRYDRTCQVAERMRTDVQVGVAIDDLKVANQLMITYGRGFLPVVSAEGTLLSVVFKKDLDKHIQHPHATIDAHKRLRVGAAVSTHPEDRERVQALLEHDVDVLVIDASDGHTAFQRDMVTWIKSLLCGAGDRRQCGHQAGFSISRRRRGGCGQSRYGDWLGVHDAGGQSYGARPGYGAVGGRGGA